MVLNIDPAAILRAAEALKQQQAQSTKSSTSTKDTKDTKKASTKSSMKSSTKGSKDTKSTAQPHPNCIVDPTMTSAITAYLYSRPDMISKLANPEKSIEKCCQYIIDRVRREAMKQPHGSLACVFAENDDVFGMAVHYYDESNEALAKEAKEG